MDLLIIIGKMLVDYFKINKIKPIKSMYIVQKMIKDSLYIGYYLLCKFSLFAVSGLSCTVEG